MQTPSLWSGHSCPLLLIVILILPLILILKSEI